MTEFASIAGHRVSVPKAKRPQPTIADAAAIGLSGFARSGKTTAANYIEDRYGFERLHIAEPLRDMLRTLLTRWFLMAADQVERYLTGDLKEDVISVLGVTSRHAQISLGTEWGREQVGADLWANAWEVAAAGRRRAMNDSVRFPNEETAVRRRKGVTILIRRAGTGPAAFIGWKALSRLLYRFGIMWGVHPSERVDLLKPDFVIDNDGSMDDLFAAIDRIMDLPLPSNH